MAEIRVSQTALLAEIQAQIAEASQVAILAELDQQAGFTSQFVSLIDIDPIMVRVSGLHLLIELEPPGIPVGRDERTAASPATEAATSDNKALSDAAPSPGGAPGGAGKASTGSATSAGTGSGATTAPSGASPTSGGAAAGSVTDATSSPIGGAAPAASGASDGTPTTQAGAGTTAGSATSATSSAIAARATSSAIAAAAARAVRVSPAAARAGNELFATLAAGRAAVALGSVLSSAGAGSSGMSEVRSVTPAVYIDWDRNGVYTNEAANLVSVRGSSSLTAPQQALTSGKGMVDRCTVVLYNNGSRYSTLNEDSALAAYIGEGAIYQAPILVDVTLDGNTYNLFLGVVRAITEEAPTPTAPGTVTLDCRSLDDLLLQQKLSTAWAEWAASIAAGAETEDQHIIAILEAVGLVDGTEFVSQAYADAHSGDLNPPRPTIDNGIFALPYVWLDDESPLEEIWEIVAACCGWFYVDVFGKFHYHNLAGVLPAMMERHYGVQTTVDITETISARLGLSWRDSDLFSEVTVAATPMEIEESGVIWETDRPVVVTPGATKTLWAKFDKPAAAELLLAWTARTAGGTDVSGSVTVARTDYAQRTRLEVTNGSSQAAYITATLTGQIYSKRDDVDATAAVDGGDTFWSARTPRLRSIRNNLYVQGEAQAQSVADYVLARCKRPQLVASIANLDDPAVQVGRRCTVRYPGVIGGDTDFEGLVMAANWTIDAKGFRQNVEIFDTSRFLGGVSDFFVIGTSKLGASGTGTAPLFY